MRTVLLLSLVLAFPGIAAAQGGAGDKPPAKGPADADRRMTEDIEIMRRLLERSIDNAVGLSSFQGQRWRTNLNPYVTNPGLGQGFFSGLTPAGTLTPDLNINTIYSSALADYASMARVHTGATVEGTYLKGYGVVFTITLPRAAAAAPG